MNAEIPKAPRAGDKLSAAQLAQVMNVIRRFMPIQGFGIRVTRTMGGSVISAKPTKGGGGGGIGKLIPWTCEYHTERNSEGDITYENYGFFLPESATLQIDGIDINFSREQESSYQGGVMQGSEWRCYSDIGFSDSGGEGFIYCAVIYDASDKAYYGKMVMDSEDSGSGGSGSGGSGSGGSGSSDSGEEYVLKFPVAWIHEEINSDSEGSGDSGSSGGSSGLGGSSGSSGLGGSSGSSGSGGSSEPTISRQIQQLAYGTMVVGGFFDKGTFRIEGAGSSMKLTHCYYMQENAPILMSDVEVGSQSWAGNFVWLVVNSENSGSVMAGDYSTMTQMCLDDTNTCVPLYKFDSDGHMEIDMRSIPTIQEWMLFSSNSSGSSN